MFIASPLTVADRFMFALEGLYRAVAARSARGFFGEAPLETALIWLVCHRVRQVERRILGMLARFQAGRLRVCTPRQGGDESATPAGVGTRLPRGPTAKVPRGPTAKLPRGLAWLLPMVPSAAASFASQLRVVLAEPEMMALLAASAQARRVLAPLCRMLGIEASVLTPRSEGAVEPVVKLRVRKPRVSVDWGRIPLPRGVLSAARRDGFRKS